MAGGGNSYMSMATPNDAKNYTNEVGQIQWAQIPLNAALDKLKTSREGLTSDEAQRRIAEYGPNKLPEEKVNKLMVFLSFMWNPLSWAMEVAAILSIVLLDYSDFALILFLLLLNAIIGYLEEIQAGDAVSALMGQLAPEAKVFRDGEIVNIGADQLVPGDVIRVRLGDVIPADLKFLEGDAVKIDQSSLTGESLPVTKNEGDEGYSGSVVKQGEIEAVVTSTGINTFLGRAAEKIASADSHGRLQMVLTTVGNFCMISIITWCIIELVAQMGVRSDENPCFIKTDGCLGVANILVLIVGGIPVAMPTVLSVTLAIGSSALAKENAIVTRLTCIEEMASMEVLCSDKTGTLTLNQLSVDMDNLIPYNGFTTGDILKFGALAARIENNEAIDVVCYNTYPGKDTIKEEFTLLHYTPFDPTTKRTIAKLKDNKTGEIFRACKGAPQIVLDMDVDADELRAEVEERIDEFASRGYRGLGVAVDRSGDVPVEQCQWKMIGLLPLFDPPRHDTADTVKKAIELGIAVKMVTGDQRAIAVETCRQLGMPTNILDTSFFNQTPPPGLDLAQMIYDTDGFAQVFPEHKFEIVKHLQSLNKVVGMTGDGVNDAPALAQADIGIAVDDATDAARAAADIVLVSPGLSVIITAIRMSREIFLRMKNYAMYSIAMTVRIVFTFGILTVAWNWYFPTLLVVILAILNDGTILTISKDNVRASPLPDSWKLKQVFIMSICFGLWLTLSTIVLFYVANNTDGFESTGVENLCVGCMKDQCDGYFQWQYQDCAKNGNSSVCGEIDGSVIKSSNTTAVGTFRKGLIEAYEQEYTSKYDTFNDLFKDLADVHLNDLDGDVQPSAVELYDQYKFQYTNGAVGGAFGEHKDYVPFAAAQNGEGVTFVGNDRVPLTNEVSYCEFMWSFSDFNSTWTKGYKMIGPGQQRKEGVLRSVIYTQVSISGQALIFVTRTAGTNNWCFMEKPANILLVAFVFAQIVASVIGWVGFSGYPTDRISVIGCGGGYTLIAWIWAIIWHFPLDLIKFSVNYLINKGAGTYSQTAFTSRINAGHPTLTHSVVTNQQRSIRASRTV
jgi:H+-transporting ATPase